MNMTKAVRGNWVASTGNAPSLPSKSQSAQFTRKHAAQNSSKLRRTRKILQKRKKWPATTSNSHHSGFARRCKANAAAAQTPMTTASVAEKRKPQLRGLWVGSHMEVNEFHAAFRVQQHLQVAKRGFEVAGPQVAAAE